MDILIRPRFRWPVYHRYRLEDPDPRIEYIKPPFGGYKIAPTTENCDWREFLEIDPKLYERFSALSENPSKEKFLKFARTYGTLEEPGKELWSRNLADWLRVSLQFHSWITGSWEAEYELNEAYRAQAEEETGEQEFIKQDRKGNPILDKDGNAVRITITLGPPLDKEFYQHLCSPERHLSLMMGDLKPFLDRDPDTGGMELTITPQSLLSAMALQMANYFGREKRGLRHCKNCNTPIPFGPGTDNTASRLYCNDHCRNKWRYENSKRRSAQI